MDADPGLCSCEDPSKGVYHFAQSDWLTPFTQSALVTCTDCSGHRERDPRDLEAARTMLDLRNQSTPETTPSSPLVAGPSGHNQFVAKRRAETTSADVVPSRNSRFFSPLSPSAAEAISAANASPSPPGKGKAEMVFPNNFVNPALPIALTEVDPLRPFAPMEPAGGLVPFRPETLMRQLKMPARLLSVVGLLYPRATFCVTLWPPSAGTTVRMSGEALAKFGALLPPAALDNRYLVDLRIRDWPSGGVAIIPNTPEAVGVAKEIEGGFDKIADCEAWYFRSCTMSFDDGGPPQPCIKILRAYVGVNGAQSDEGIEQWFDNHTGLVNDDPNGRVIAERMEYGEDVLHDPNAQVKRKKVPVIVPLNSPSQSEDGSDANEGDDDNEGGDDGDDHDGYDTPPPVAQRKKRAAKGNTNNGSVKKPPVKKRQAKKNPRARRRDTQHTDAAFLNTPGLSGEDDDGENFETNNNPGHESLPHPTFPNNDGMDANTHTQASFQPAPEFANQQGKNVELDAGLPTQSGKNPRANKKANAGTAPASGTGRRPAKRKKLNVDSDYEDGEDYNPYAASGGRAQSRSSGIGSGATPRAARIKAEIALKAEAEAEAEAEIEVEVEVEQYVGDYVEFGAEDGGLHWGDVKQEPEHEEHQQQFEGYDDFTGMF